MHCPKCQFDHELQTTECLKCGIIFSRYRPPVETAASEQVPPISSEVSAGTPVSVVFHEPAISRDEAIREWKYRALALPAALLLARLIAATPLRIACSELAMVLHESGHAITAWLTGRWAVPLLWVTPHGQERSWLIVFAVAAAILFGGFVAWKTERWRWVVAAAAALLLQVIVLSYPADALIVFWGDGGALVLATVLMAMFYVPRDSAIAKSWGLRWGLLIVGALSFMHVFLLWTGPIDDLPFGEIEGVNLSDPSLLVEMHGWSVAQLVERYVHLGEACLVFLAALYVWGLVSGYLQVAHSSPGEKHSAMQLEPPKRRAADSNLR